jgi:bacterioferritin-associated ferredoxin
MIVCVCNALNEQTCREAIASERCSSAGGVHRACGCRIRCGRCLPAMRSLFDSVREGAELEPSGLSLPAVAAAPER